MKKTVVLILLTIQAFSQEKHDIILKTNTLNWFFGVPLTLEYGIKAKKSFSMSATLNYRKNGTGDIVNAQGNWFIADYRKYFNNKRERSLNGLYLAPNITYVNKKYVDKLQNAVCLGLSGGLQISLGKRVYFDFGAGLYAPILQNKVGLEEKTLFDSSERVKLRANLSLGVSL